MPCAQPSNARSRTDRFEAVFVITRINHPDELDEKRVKLNLVVSTICANKRDGRGRTRLDTPHGIAQWLNFPAKLIEQYTITCHLITDGFSQFGQTLRINHEREQCRQTAATRNAELSCTVLVEAHAQCSIHVNEFVQGEDGLAQVRQGMALRIGFWFAWVARRALPDLIVEEGNTGFQFAR